MSWRDAVRQDFERVLGKALLVKAVEGFAGDNSTTVHLDPPAVVRVVASLDEDLFRVMDERHVDPRWNVESDDQRVAHLTGLNIYGHGRFTDGSPNANEEIIEVAK